MLYISVRIIVFYTYALITVGNQISFYFCCGTVTDGDALIIDIIDDIIFNSYILRTFAKINGVTVKSVKIVDSVSANNTIGYLIIIDGIGIKFVITF